MPKAVPWSGAVQTEASSQPYKTTVVMTGASVLPAVVMSIQDDPVPHPKQGTERAIGGRRVRIVHEMAVSVVRPVAPGDPASVPDKFQISAYWREGVGRCQLISVFLLTAAASAEEREKHLGEIIASLPPVPPSPATTASPPPPLATSLGRIALGLKRDDVVAILGAPKKREPLADGERLVFGHEPVTDLSQEAWIVDVRGSDSSVTSLTVRGSASTVEGFRLGMTAADFQKVYRAYPVDRSPSEEHLLHASWRDVVVTAWFRPSSGSFQLRIERV